MDKELATQVLEALRDQGDRGIDLAETYVFWHFVLKFVGQATTLAFVTILMGGLFCMFRYVVKHG